MGCARLNLNRAVVFLNQRSSANLAIEIPADRTSGECCVDPLRPPLLVGMWLLPVPKIHLKGSPQSLETTRGGMGGPNVPKTLIGTYLAGGRSFVRGFEALRAQSLLLAMSAPSRIALNFSHTIVGYTSVL